MRTAVNHFARAPQGERDLVEQVAACALSFENGVGVDFKERCEKFYKQYRSFSQWRNAWERTGPRDKDEVLREGKRTWGSNLHIPLSFRTIETMVPRAIAHRPRMLYLPREERWERNVQAVRLLIDAQQERIDIDLPFQAVMRSGRIYGLGVGKVYWRKDVINRRTMRRRTLRSDQWVPQTEQVTTFDDPVFEDVDVFDFMWDPYGSCMDTAQWTIHRTWLSLGQCLQRIRMGAWNTASATALTEDDLRGLGSGQKYDEVWAERMAASGFGSFHQSVRGEQIHEVWEWHDGERVLTALDRTVLVQDAENPCYGTMPFGVYRPTPLQKQMVGIGDMEPLEHLQRELDTLRSQRRDAATIALCAGYAYDEAAIQEEDLVFGPGVAIPVSNARPSDAIFPLPVRDVPGSSYQEEQVIRTDFDAVSGISDALSPENGGSIGTATEAQLVQAALSRRIELASRRFEVEIVRRAAHGFLHLDQRMIASERDVRIRDDQQPAGEGYGEARWKWYTLDPDSLRGEFEVIPEGGSMAARNVPQDRQDAVQIMQLYGDNPHIDPRRPLLKSLGLFGIKDPEAWLRQTDPPVPPAVFKVLADMRVNPALIQRAIQVAQQQDPRLPVEEQGPDVQQVDQMMGEAA